MKKLSFINFNFSINNASISTSINKNVNINHGKGIKPMIYRKMKEVNSNNE